MIYSLNIRQKHGFIATSGVVMSYGRNFTGTALALKSGNPYFDWAKIAIPAVPFFELSGLAYNGIPAVPHFVRRTYGKDLFARQVFKCSKFFKLVVPSVGWPVRKRAVPREGFMAPLPITLIPTA